VGHLDPAQWYEDLLRAADLTSADGSRLLRLPAAAVRLDAPRVVAILRASLALPDEPQAVRLAPAGSRVPF